MAHLAHALPWTTLSTSLLATKHGPRGTPDRITVLSPDPSPAAQKQRRHFIRAFARTLAAFSATERRKHPTNPLATTSPTEDQDNPTIFADTTTSALQRHLASPHAHAALDGLSPRRASGWAPLAGYADPRAELVMAMVAAGAVAGAGRAAVAAGRAVVVSRGESGVEQRRGRGAGGVFVSERGVSAGGAVDGA